MPAIYRSLQSDLSSQAFDLGRGSADSRTRVGTATERL